MTKKTIEEVQVASVAPLVGPEGPQGILLITAEGNYLALRGAAVLTLLGAPAAAPRKRPPRPAPGPQAHANGNGPHKYVRHRCLVKGCGKVMSSKANARTHVQNLHKVDGDPGRYIEVAE